MTDKQLRRREQAKRRAWSWHSKHPDMPLRAIALKMGCAESLVSRLLTECYRERTNAHE